MRERMKNLMAALLLAAAFLTAAIPARAEAREMRGPGPGTTWVAWVLGWLGLPPQGLGSIWETSSANIDPNGQSKPDSGGELGASASSDDSANIDPNG